MNKKKTIQSRIMKMVTKKIENVSICPAVRVFRLVFLTGPAPKSVEDRKIPTKKVKLDLSNSNM